MDRVYLYNKRIANVDKNLMIYVKIFDADQDKNTIKLFKEKYDLKFGYPSIFMVSTSDNTQVVNYNKINMFEGNRNNLDELYNFVVSNVHA
jgi:hypothetical protein